MKPAQLDWAKSWLKKSDLIYINKRWVKGSGSQWEVTNPCKGEVLSSFSLASVSDVEQAIEAAYQCHSDRKWLGINMRERARLLRAIGQVARDHQAELATLESLANGKTYQESYEDDLPDCGDIFDYYAGWIGKHYGESVPVEDGFLNYTVHEPVGVCGLIVPWNFPLLMACWKIAPALATGNTLVIKPSEFTPYSLVRFFELIHEKVDLPAGLLNLVVGGSDVGEALTRSNKVHKIAFTGSTGTGRNIVNASAQSNLKHLSLELGGKSPNIIFADAPDLEAAIERSYQVMFSHKGEKCSEPTRLIVHESVYAKVLDGLKSRAQKVKCGDAFDPTTNQGAQCHKAHFKKILHYIEVGKKEGAKLLVGGERDTQKGNEKGFFVRPTVFSDVDRKMAIFQDEIFGPVLCVTPFQTEEQAVAIANDCIYGLAAGFWTKDVSRAHRVAGLLDAGMIFVNRYGCYEFSSPFGGFRQSGWGKEMGIHSLSLYTKTKSVWLKI